MSIDDEVAQYKILFHNILNGISIKESTAKLQELYTRPSCLVCLTMLCDNKQAAIELRKLITEKWSETNVNDREIIKKQLFTSNSKDVAYCLQSICAQEEWNCYEQIIEKLKVNQAQGMLLLFLCFDFLQKDKEIFFIASEAIKASDLESRILSCQLLCRIAENIEENDKMAVSAFQQTIPEIVAVLQTAVHQQQDTSKIFQCFDELLLLEAPLLQRHFVDLIKLFLEIASNPQVHEDTRTQSLSFMIWCIMSAKQKILKNKLSSAIIEAMFSIGAECNEDISNLAIQVLNTLSTTLAPERVFPTTIQLCIQKSQSQLEGDRTIAMLAISGIVEGCADYMRNAVKEILGLVLGALQDPTIRVRKAATIALSTLLEEFDQIQQQHAQIIPLLYNMLDTQELAPDALIALDNILETMENIDDYIEPLMQKLLAIWNAGDEKVAVTATNCVGSVAYASKEKFAKFYEPVIQQLSIFMHLQNPEELSLRAVATDCIGAVAGSCGKDAFRPYLHAVMENVLSGLQISSTHLKQCSYVLFGVLAKIYGDEFGAFLQLIVPPLLEACSQEEQEYGQVIGDDEEETQMFNGIAQEKESSIDALADLFQATKQAFLPYLSESMNMGIMLVDHHYEQVRITASGSLLSMFETIYLMDNPAEWTPGLPLPKKQHENVENIGKLSIECVLCMLAEEEERNVVTRVVTLIGDTLKSIGPVVLHQSFDQQGSHLDVLANLLLSILQGQHPCQQETGFEEFEGEEDLAELDGLVYTAAADTVAAISSALGAQFVPYFEQYLRLIVPFCTKSSSADRSMAIGALAECVDGLGPACTPFTRNMMEIFVRGMQDSDAEVRSNSAFGAGVLVDHTTESVGVYYGELLRALEPLFVKTETNMKDNAIGCLSRMILKAPDQLPLEQMLQGLLQALPLDKDFEEYRPLFKMLITLLAKGNEFLNSELSKVFSLMGYVADNKQLDSVTKEMIHNFLVHFSNDSRFNNLGGPELLAKYQ